MLEQEVQNVRFFIDLITKAATDYGIKNGKVNYARCTPSCTIVYRDVNLRKFTALKPITEKFPNVQVKYPSTIIINNATSPSMLQKLIIWKLCELNFSDYTNVNVSSNKEYIEIERSAYDKAQNKEIIEQVFTKTETELKILFKLDENIFNTQKQFIVELI